MYRKAIKKILQEDPNIQVVGTAADGAKAITFIKCAQELPDLVTLDLEMPGMNGIDTLKAIKELSKTNGTNIGVLMVSSRTRHGAETTIEALEAGAFDFVLKPSGGDNQEQSMAMLRTSLMVKVRYYDIVTHHSAGRHKKLVVPKPAEPPVPAKALKEAVRGIVIGVSTGGPQCLSQFLPSLCEAVSLPILIVQHMPPMFTETLAKSLNVKCSHEVREAAEGDVVAPNKVFIAPGGRHMIVKKNGGGPVLIGLNDQAAENGCKPSADVLFRSAAEVFNGSVVSIILTGMGSDGSGTMGLLKNAGAHVIAQDEATSVVWGMPKSAVSTGFVDEILPLMEIPAAVKREIDKRNVQWN